jgi:lipid-A-disaccharide synthase
MFVILPFEKAFYKEHGIDVDFPGHPLLDEIRLYDEEMPKKDYGDSEKEIIAVLPGSRKQEIQKMLPLMLKVKEFFPGYHYIVAGVKSLRPDFYHSFLPDDVDLVYGETYSLLRASKAAIVTSGTATLEAALLGAPEIICYKGNFISYYIAKNLVKIDYIGLPNLIMNRHIVKELIQNDFTLVNLKNELKKILEDTHYRANIQNDYSVLVDKLGGYGASAKTATLMLKYLKE